MALRSGRLAIGVSADTPVLTSRGRVIADHLVAGDVVVDVAGDACLVKSVGRGFGPVTRVQLTDGSAVTAGRDQVLSVEVGSRLNRVPSERTTSQVAELLDRRVPVRMVRAKPVVMPGLPEPPLSGYLLGVLLGDGCISSGESVVLWTSEDETRGRAEAALPAGARFSEHPVRQARCTGWGITATVPGRGRNPVLNALRELGLSGRRSYEKLVPATYRWSSVADRVALLNGLLDTDGGVTAQAEVSFSSASPQLADDVAHLVRSLGGRCRQSVRRNITFTSPTSPTRKPARDSYRVSGISLPDYDLFQLSRKAARVRADRNSSQWTVRSVLPGPWQQLVALEVDSPTKLFLTDGFIPVQSCAAVHELPTVLQAA